MTEIRVVLADDQTLLRRSLAALIDSEPDLTVVGEAATGADAIAVARATRPDLVLMDIRMPEIDGLTATRRLCADPNLAGTRVVVLTMFELDEYVVEALRAGASGFLLKDTPPQALVDALRTVHAGRALLSPRALGVLVERSLPTAGPRGSLDGLTPRQTEILTLVARGLSNDQIEAELRITRATLKTHISALLARLGARDRAQLVIAAYEGGLVVPGCSGPA
ncbi:MAG: response regulator transcription factor [Propioniciclava sp.]|uniref:response regulator n=1 Tax=Propioniciclava sp. TaxID=2038686 RepID=UPI0039E57471